MAFKFSKKVLLITKDTKLAATFNIGLREFGHELDNKFLNLKSISIMQKIITKTMNTSFIRSELFRFIKENGYPAFISLDFFIDSGLGKELDPDNFKIFRTFLISYIVLSRGKGFENINGGFLLLCNNNKQLQWLEKYNNQPHLILDILTTKDRVVNSFIEELKKDPYKFNQLFYIKGISLTQEPETLVTEIREFITKLAEREKLNEVKNQFSELDDNNYDPGKVVYKINENSIYVDGDIVLVASEEYKSYAIDQFYISGYWTHKTQAEVIKKLKNAILLGLSKDKHFETDDKIMVNMLDTCIIDGSIAISISGILAKELSSYPYITFRVNKTNGTILQKSQGFTLIKKYVRWTE